MKSAVWICMSQVIGHLYMYVMPTCHIYHMTIIGYIYIFAAQQRTYENICSRYKDVRVFVADAGSVAEFSSSCLGYFRRSPMWTRARALRTEQGGEDASWNGHRARWPTESYQGKRWDWQGKTSRFHQKMRLLARIYKECFRKIGISQLVSRDGQRKTSSSFVLVYKDLFGTMKQIRVGIVCLSFCMSDSSLYCNPQKTKYCNLSIWFSLFCQNVKPLYFIFCIIAFQEAPPNRVAMMPPQWSRVWVSAISSYANLSSLYINIPSCQVELEFRDI